MFPPIVYCNKKKKKNAGKLHLKEENSILCSSTMGQEHIERFRPSWHVKEPGVCLDSSPQWSYFLYTTLTHHKRLWNGVCSKWHSALGLVCAENPRWRLTNWTDPAPSTTHFGFSVCTKPLYSMSIQLVGPPSTSTKPSAAQLILRRQQRHDLTLLYLKTSFHKLN